MKTLADRVAHAREARGWNQSELARRVGVKPQAVQQIESGQTKRSKFLPEIAAVTGFSLSWLLSGEGAMLPEGNAPLTPDERALLEKYRLLNQMGKNYAQKALDAFASEEGGGKVGNDG